MNTFNVNVQSHSDLETATTGEYSLLSLILVLFLVTMVSACAAASMETGAPCRDICYDSITELFRVDINSENLPEKCEEVFAHGSEYHISIKI